MPRKDLTSEIQKRRASLNSANKTRTPANLRNSATMTSTGKSTNRTVNSVCRSINFAQLKENNSKLLNNRSPVSSPNLRSNRPLSQLNQANNPAVNIIRQHRANNLLRNNVRNLQNQRRLDNRDANDKQNEMNPSKLISLLNSTNLLNENNEKSKKESTIKQSTSRLSSMRPSAQKQQANLLADKKLNNNNLVNSTKQSTKTVSKTTAIKQQQPYSNIPSPSKLINHDLNSTSNRSTNQLNQDAFSYSNNKFYDDDDHCVSEIQVLNSNKHNKTGNKKNDKIYTEQSLSASCNRLSQIQPSMPAAMASCSTPSLNNSLNNGQNVPSSVLLNYEIGGVIGDGNFAVVHQCAHKRTRRKYALKIIDKTKCAGKEAMIENEVQILRKIKHPNIVQLYEDYDYLNELYLVMELVYVSLNLIFSNNFSDKFR